MIKYGDLNLKGLREKCNLDFAHFTYSGNLCSCCYGATDLPSIYWKDRIIKNDNYTYILFKNACNGSGVVTKKNVIEDNTSIEHIVDELEFDEKIKKGLNPDIMVSEQMDKIIEELEKQLGDDYWVIPPKTSATCITIRLKSKFNINNYKPEFSNTEKDKRIIYHCSRNNVHPTVCAWYENEEDFLGDWVDIIGYSEEEAKNLLITDIDKKQFLTFEDGTICRFVI